LGTPQSEVMDMSDFTNESGMTEDAPKRQPGSGASPEARRWTTRRDAARAAVANDRERARKAHAERKEPIEQEPYHPIVFFIGLLVAALLFIAIWFIVDRLRCDPFYSNAGFARLHVCK
jgi:hypothetical protein